MKKFTFSLLLISVSLSGFAQKTWSRIDTPIPGHSIMDFRFLPGFAWYHLDGSNPVAKGIYKSTDDGTTWTRANLPASVGGPFDQFRQIHYFSAQEAIIMYYDMSSKRMEFNYTADDGATQTLLSDTTFADYKNTGNVAPSPCETSGLTMVDKNFGYGYTLAQKISTGMTMHLFTVTRDGGKSWEDISLGGIIRQVQFLDNQIGYMSVGNSVFKTTDGGANWLPVLSNSHIMPSMYFIDANEGYVSKDANLGFKELVKTTDGGQTWTTVFDDTKNFTIYNAATTQPFKYTTEIKFYDSNYGVFSGAANAGYIVATTTDGGLTWTADSIDGYSGQISLKKMQMFSGGARGIEAGGLYGEGNVSFSTSSIMENVFTEISIYPNPAVNQFTIESESNIKAEIYNLSGILIKRLSLNSGKNEVILNVPEGLYLINAGNSIHKIFINN